MAWRIDKSSPLLRDSAMTDEGPRLALLFTPV
jgi:hypothetical protein